MNQKNIETPLGRLLVQGEIRDGREVVADADGESRIVFTTESAAREAETTHGS